MVFAGGSSSRMGTDKALVEVAGVPMIAWVVTALESACGNIIISGRQGRMVGYECVPDDPSDVAGPLAGLVTIVNRIESSELGLVAVAVDHPFVRRATLERLVERYDGTKVVVPVADDIRQVTVAVYPPSIGSVAQEVLGDGGSLQTLLDRAEVDEVFESEWRQWGEDGRSWFSVDSSAAVSAGLASYGLPFE